MRASVAASRKLKVSKNDVWTESDSNAVNYQFNKPALIFRFFRPALRLCVEHAFPRSLIDVFYDCQTPSV